MKLVCINTGTYNFIIDKVYDVSLHSSTDPISTTDTHPVNMYVIFDDTPMPCVFTNSTTGSGPMVWDYFCTIDKHRQKQLTKIL